MKAFTVNDLAVACKEMKSKGLGSKKILISDDDEGNGYHELFFGFSENVEDFDMIGMPFGVSGENINEYIILG